MGQLGRAIIEAAAQSLADNLEKEAAAEDDDEGLEALAGMERALRALRAVKRGRAPEATGKKALAKWKRRISKFEGEKAGPGMTYFSHMGKKNPGTWSRMSRAVGDTL